MSVVIAIKDKNKIYMGCDSQVSGDNLKFTLSHNTSKIAKSKQSENILIGGVGSLRDIQIIHHYENLIPEINLLKNNIDLSLVINTITINIYNKLKNFERINTKDNNGLAQIDSQFMIAYKDKCWLIGNDLSVMEIDDYLCCGSGIEVASGILENTKNLDPKTRIKKAIDACDKLTLYIDNNIEILHT